VTAVAADLDVLDLPLTEAIEHFVRAG